MIQFRVDFLWGNTNIKNDKITIVSYIIEIRTRLKTYDLISGTAFVTLKEDMGWGGILESLSREEMWKIKVNTTREEAKRLGEEFTRKVKIFINPNKHLWDLRILEKEEKLCIEGEGKGIYSAEVLTWWLEDAKERAAFDSLKNTWGYAEVIEGVKRGDIWKLRLKADSLAQAKKYIEEIIVSKSQGKGLIINPHSQEYRLLSLCKL
ncbi:hypothetical protein J7K43_03810 [Candidatus Calescamantes bacterium]|nr:hypothetical protein [Candidatus Calescamantes bacterium]